MLRPAWLKQARTDFAADRISTAQFKRVEDRAVDEAIALQERCGVDVVTDGEMRRSGFVAPLTDYVEGFEAVAFDTRRWQGGGGTSGETSLTVPLTVTGKLRRRRSLAAEEFIYARARATRPLKATLPSPLMLAMRWSPEHSAAAYPDPFALFADAVDILRAEVARTGEPGMRIYPGRRAGTRHAGRPVNARARLRGAWNLDRADARRGRRDAQRARGYVRRHLRVASVPRQQRRPLAEHGRLRGDLEGGLRARHALRHFPARIRQSARRLVRAARRPPATTSAWCWGWCRPRATRSRRPIR